MMRTHEDTVWIAGVVRYHEEDLTASTGAPSGFWVDSSGIERIYLEHENISEVVDKPISARGHLRIVCGHNHSTCYPMIEVEHFQIRRPR
jgi:hypothetical protein